MVGLAATDKPRRDVSELNEWFFRGLTSILQMRDLVTTPYLRLSIAAFTLGAFSLNAPAFAQGLQSPVLPSQKLPARIDPLDPPTLTSKQKVGATLQRFGWGQIAVRFALAGLDQARDDPEDWGKDWTGYGQRLGDRFGRIGVSYGVQLAANIALGTDPRYDQCACEGILPRTGHAVRRMFIARRDRGGETVNVAQLGGAIVPQVVAYTTWLPRRERTWENGLSSIGFALLGTAGNHVFREFWPDIRQRVPFLRKR